MNSTSCKALEFAYSLNGEGRGVPLDLDEAFRGKPDGRITWMHLCYTQERSQQWLQSKSSIPETVLDALLVEDTRPRTFDYEGGTLVILRGVNLNPGAQPEDMVSIRVWVEPCRIITISHRRLIALEDVAQSLSAGIGPKNSGEFIVDLCRCLVQRMETVVGHLDDLVAELEDDVLVLGNYQLRGKISTLRRQAIRLRRYLAPQREVLTHLCATKGELFGESQKLELRSITDQITRYVEDIDATKDRAAIIQDELENRLGAQMNKTMYLLSLVAGIFLPLGLLTGLLGINVGGIPGTESPYAFTVVCLMLLIIGVFQIVLFRKMRWM